MPNGEYSIHRGAGESALENIDEITSLYSEVYAEPPYNSAPLYSRETFLSRTTRQSARDGFTIITARGASGELVGFSFGLPFPAGRWWSGNASPPPADVLGADKFAVIELVVAAKWRGHGVGGRLLRELLSDRPEKLAMLTADPSAPARQIYTHWGWEQVGTAQHAEDAPIMDQLILRR